MRMKIIRKIKNRDITQMARQIDMCVRVCSIRLKILFYFASTSVNQPENSNTPITDAIKAHPAVGKDSSRCLVKSLSQTT